MKEFDIPSIDRTQIVSGNGTIPIVLHLPHNSMYTPTDYEFSLSTEAQKVEIFRLIDHHTDRLFSPFLERGCMQILNPFCRMYFDPERFADPEKEAMNKIGMGVFYTHTTNGLRFRSDDTAEKYEQKIKRLYLPYHKIFYDVCIQTIKKFGFCIVIDGHSYAKDILPYERFPTDRRPEIDLGTDDQHTPSWLQECSHEVFSAAGFSVEYNQPYRGTLVPLPLYGDRRLSSLMLEIRRDVYLQYDPYEKGLVLLDEEKVAFFHTVLHRLIDRLQEKTDRDSILQ